MVVVSSQNSKTKIIGRLSNDWDTNDAYQKAIRAELSYQVPDADWSPKYKEGVWDGLISLYDRKNQEFPTGLASQVLSLLESLGIQYTWEDNRSVPVKNTNIETRFAENGRTLRWYQEAAADAALTYGRGVLAMPTGSGKTLAACEILSRMKVSPVVFIVPSISLLKQTRSEFQKYLSIDGLPANIGAAGGGIFELQSNGINVITYQTALLAFSEVFQKTASKKGKANSIIRDELAGETVKKTLTDLQGDYKICEKALNWAQAQAGKTFDQTGKMKYDRWVTSKTKKENALYSKAKSNLSTRLKNLERKAEIRELIENCQALIVDEVHLAAVIIESLSNKTNRAWYKFGLSATPFRTDNQEIRIQGAFGRKLIQITASDLIKLGYLVPARIFMLKLKQNHGGDTWNEIYKNNVVDNWERNYLAKLAAEAFQSAGRPVLVLVDRIEHGKTLESMIKASVFVAGSDDEEAEPDDTELDYRRRMLNDCESNKIILIATSWAYTGIDAPKISCLVLAGSCQSTVTTYQQTGRVLRTIGPDLATSILNGKPDAIVVDFYDMNTDLRRHANQRRRVYRNEEEFQFQLVG